MKRLAIALLFLVMVLGVAGMAAAYPLNLQPGDIMLVAYVADPGDPEQFIDPRYKEKMFKVGNISTFTGQGSGLFNYDTIQGDSEVPLNVGMFAYKTVGEDKYLYIGSTQGAPNVKPSFLFPTVGVATSIANLHNSVTNPSQLITANSGNAYYNKFNLNDIAGFYGGFNAGDGAGGFNGEVTLEDSFDVGTLYLYGYKLINGVFSEIGGSGAEAMATISGNGSVTLVTPIPASVLLFGSSLLGVFGLRRKRG